VHNNFSPLHFFCVCVFYFLQLNTHTHTQPTAHSPQRYSINCNENDEVTLNDVSQKVENGATVRADDDDGAPMSLVGRLGEAKKLY
jgi:hypothetical protein